jgi:DNA sulfur modification protein DndD
LCNAAGVPEAIALLQAPNGTAKTTTLNLLKACMHGLATFWSSEEIQKFRRNDDERSYGVFTTFLKIDGRQVTIELRLDFEDGKASYRTSTTEGGGVRPFWDPPTESKKFLDQRFLNLFVFDGEYAKRLLNPNEAEAEYAIDALCQLYLLRYIAQVASDAWEREAKKVTVKTETGLRGEYSKQEAIQARIANLKKAEAQWAARLKDVDLEVTRLKQLVEDRLSSEISTREQHARAGAALSQAKADVDKYSLGLAQAIRNPQALHPKIGQVLNFLKENLDQLRLPENTSAQFFEELSQSEACICGTEMTPALSEHIRVSAKDYLGDKEIGVINVIKADIEKYVVSDQGVHPYNDLILIRDGLTAARMEAKKADQKLRTLSAKLIEGGDASLEAWETSLKKAIAEQGDLNSALSKLSEDKTDRDYRTSQSLPFLQRSLEETNNRISEITKTVDLRQRTDIIREILDRASVKAQEKIKLELLEICNELLKNVLVNDLLQIESIDKSLNLANQKGASEGQTLSVGYVFLMSILSRGSNDFPLVVDSPAGALDTDVRNQIGTLIPSLCSQFVAFTIDTERDGFVTGLEDTGKKIKFMTLFRKGEKTERFMSKLPSDGVTVTETAVLVEGREYFFNFNDKRKQG